jgi:hypothetical protein
MKISNTKAQQLQKFIQEAPQHFPDLLALDGEAAWKTLFPDLPIPFGLRAVWRRAQVELAARRILLAAAPLDIPLQTEMERGHLAKQLLTGGDDLADTSLLAWLRSLSPSHGRHLKEQVELLYPRLNLQGYRAIAAEAARLGWPKFFRQDLAIDLKVVCIPDAPKYFWWGVRSTGTDLYRPNEVWDIEWAEARKEQGPEEQRYYRYNGDVLYSIALDTLIVQLAHALDVASYAQKREMTLTALTQAESLRSRDWGTAKAYDEALQASKRADEDLRKVKRFKQRYR